MNKQPEGNSLPHVENTSENGVLPTKIFEHLRKKIVRLLPILTACSTAACTTQMDIMPQMQHKISSSIAAGQDFPFSNVQVSPTILPQDLTISFGGLIIPIISRQSIVVNVTTGDAPEGFYVFSGAQGSSEYQVNIEKKLYDWTQKNGYQCVVDVEHGIQGAHVAVGKYAPSYTANIVIRIERPGFQTKARHGKVLEPNQIAARVVR
ncbi:hypothetical protein COW46_00170 [Candidatus Gracilibacteria bacterium CG17_big_fil_post_rev_8_21_14_2_50_48_13]|nr:MAG: hypothetical protein COW46_00170 [Candidatus Gracilibacteria bacterium CG17_big_fil_post_rev_8_21_14_2_50_48_13]